MLPARLAKALIVERSRGSVEIVVWLATASDMLKLSQHSPVAP